MITENYIVCDNCGDKIENNFESYYDIINYFIENDWTNIKKYGLNYSEILDFCPKCCKEENVKLLEE